jgi:hypothetical protein
MKTACHIRMSAYMIYFTDALKLQDPSRRATSKFAVERLELRLMLRMSVIQMSAEKKTGHPDYFFGISLSLQGNYGTMHILSGYPSRDL